MQMRLLILFFLLISSYSYSQTVEKNGVIPSYTSQAIIVEPNGNNPYFAIDGQLHSYWESENPLPDKYISDNSLNVFYKSGPNKTLLN